MKTFIRKASERGTADFGWLKPNYYFSFSHYHDPKHINFGALRVLNDDFIAGGGGFPNHPHDNMEIITIPLSGAIQHRDSTGGQGIINAGDVQIMSAGTGVSHSEANASATNPLILFQIWLFPKERNIKPRYDQRNFNTAERQNAWQIIVSPREEDKALWINQDARFALTDLTKNQTLDYNNAFSGNGIYLVVINGSVSINGQTLEKRDAMGVSDTDTISITAIENCELLAIEVPMN